MDRKKDEEEEEYLEVEEENAQASSKNSDKLKAKGALRPNVGIVMQNELLADMLYTLSEIQSSRDISKTLLQTYRAAAEADLDNSNRYNKLILGSTRLSDEEIQVYTSARTHKQIKDTYCRIVAEIAQRLGDDDKGHTFSNTSQKGGQDSEKIRLPPLDLPTFSGRYDEWLPFNNLFTSSVHNRTNLDPVQKLHYLMKAVTGDAYNQIKNLSLTNENYEHAREILEDQYNHTRKVAHTYMKKLLDCKPMHSESSRELRNFLSNTKDCLISLKSLKLPTDEWDYILLYSLQSKIPPPTFMKWEEELGSSREIPRFEQFLKFLENRFRTLEMIEVPSREKDNKKAQKALHTKASTPSANPSGNSSEKGQPKGSNKSKSQRKSYSAKNSNPTKSSQTCAICNQTHYTSQCTRFKNNSPVVRKQLAEQYKLCSNCLGSHSFDVCYSTKTCVYCNQAHHSLLHIHEANGPTRNTNTAHVTNNNQPIQPSVPQSHTHNNPHQNGQHSSAFYAITGNQEVRILGTALVRVVNSAGYAITVRALLDSGADDNYITSSTVHSAWLQKYPAAAAITGLNEVTVGSSEYKANFRIESLDGSFKYESSASVVETITSKMPSTYVDPENFGFLNNLPLADPNFNHPGKIQLLLGVSFLVRIRRPGLKKFRNLMAEQTLLGWVVMGQCAGDSHQTTLLTRSLFLTQSVSNADLSKQIQKFFEVEEFSENIPQKPEDALCEKKFLDSVQRCSDGKLSVELPFREDFPIIGASRHIAMRRFLNLEKKLEQNPTLKHDYVKTITEYLTEGHLLPVTEPTQPGREYFLPHHAVVKESSTTTRVRVVFDGSCKSSDTTSLNDHLLTGPKLQTDIRDVFFKWRTYQHALTADIAKMYRMFWIAEHHRNYQKILWRFNQNEQVSEYCLATVTFGTSSAPYQAIRALHFIAEGESSNYPLASEALLKEFYVDDFISGAHSIDVAVRKQTELRDVLEQYGLVIRKWSSNSPEALLGIDSNLKETLTELTFEEEEFRKTLGVFWAPKGDFFSFATSHFSTENQKLTKRTVLSLIARLYDPVGWVGPCTLHAKMIMQRIWEQELNWDDEVCGTIKADFEEFLEDLPNLTKLKIPRWVKVLDDSSPLTLYGFSDASLKAYGAVLYLKNPSITDGKQLILLTSRTRVKPLKHVTLARLELCAAVMLAELIEWAKNMLKPREVEVFAYSDSKIVLSWLSSHPSRWKMYVAGRTSKILETMTSDQWAYVNTKYNPADLASRGMLPSELVTSDLWWNGPDMKVIEEQETVPNLTVEDHEAILTETKAPHPVLHALSSNDSILSLLGKYSSHGKMCRVMHFITAFITKTVQRVMEKNTSKQDIYQQIVQKMSSSDNQIYRLVQRVAFAPELKALEGNQPLPRKSKLGSLYPFIDGFGILRVGGRLQNTYLTYSQKHPIILPSHHQVTTNLIHLAHHATLHGGNSLTASYLRQKFHILRCTDRIKVLLKSCPICIRYARAAHEQLMGSLPKNRVNPHRPFLYSGVDYAGPFTIKAYKGKCKKFLKSYVSLFVCFSTKSIHLELVSELTAVAFIAAFKRFVNRRGRCEKLFSDRGTNFVKGDKLLTEEIHRAQLTWKTELELDFEDMGTKWDFNPPGSPHFGGIWEAGVKSMKTHLKKTLGSTLLTTEEFNTLLIQIEGILNSRPLCPMSKDSTDFTALTPAHFLIGESIVAPPERAFDLEAKHPIDRWQHLQKLRQMFWVSWKQEYLHRLNVRPKWKGPGIEYKVNDLVILTEENCPPTYWPLAKIIETHPGRDGITRVVTLKTSKGQLFRRSTAKLRLLAYDPKDFQADGSNVIPMSPDTSLL